ncbi:MAG: Rossmann-like domain-containing protein [Spirochaetaceae bacterium]
MQKLYADKAEKLKVDYLLLGLGYTAAVLSDGSMGIAFTYITGKESCSLFHDTRDFEGAPASMLLELLFSENLVERSAALAAVNALNHTRALEFREDNDSLLEDFQVKKGDTVAMAGFFGPVAAKVEAAGASLRVHDIGKGIGEQEEFYRFLESGEAKGLVFTSTSVINGTTEEVLSHLHRNTPCAMLGPTTPMIPEVFDHLPVHYLGGIVPLEKDLLLKAVRGGRGTRAILKASKKIYYSRGF